MSLDIEALFKNVEWVNSSTDSEVAEDGRTHLRDLSIGSEFMLGDEAFILLDKDDYLGTAKVIRKEFLHLRKVFGETADWRESPIRTDLNSSYFDRISAIVGAQNIIPTHRDLISQDGLDDYGECVDNISLLTASEYAKYHRVLGLNSRYQNWWWTITPASTPSNGYSRDVCYVDSFGILNWLGCGYVRGVRPFFTLKSSILIS